MGRDRNPALAVTTVPEQLVAEFSSRSRHIDAEKNRLIAEYVEKHGRQPSTATIIKLRAQATLITRPEKQVRSLADLTAEWRQRAGRLLGRDATAWARRVTTKEAPLLLRADDVPLVVIASLGQSVVETVGEKRSTWRRWNLTAEAARQTMGYRFASTTDREAIVGLVVDAAEAASLRLTPPELTSSPVALRRPDGTSVFRPKHSTVFSSELLLAAEDRFLERARTTTAPTVPLATVERIAARPDRQGRVLGEEQTAALASVAVSGRIVDVLVGPARAGKTTAMNALRRAREHEHGRGSVVGLAPSAVAAQVLADDLRIQTENTAKWWQNHLVQGEAFRRGSSSSWTRRRWREKCPSTASPVSPPRPGRKCCWLGTTHSSSPSTPAAPSPSSSATAATPRTGRHPPLHEHMEEDRVPRAPARAYRGHRHLHRARPHPGRRDGDDGRRRLHCVASRPAGRTGDGAGHRLERIRPGA